MKGLDLPRIDSLLSRERPDLQALMADALALLEAAQQMRVALTEIEDVLVVGLGGRDGVPDEANVVHLAHAAASQLGGFRYAIDSASRVCGKWAARLDAALNSASGYSRSEIEAVRDALRRHAPAEGQR